jgi:hypothetical protein
MHDSQIICLMGHTNVNHSLSLSLARSLDLSLSPHEMSDQMSLKQKLLRVRCSVRRTSIRQELHSARTTVAEIHDLRGPGMLPPPTPPGGGGGPPKPGPGGKRPPRA